MKTRQCILLVTFGICIVSGYDIIEELIKQRGACFDVVELPDECDKTLEESFQAKSPKRGSNDITTLVYLFTPTSPDKAEPLHKCAGGLPPDSTYDPDAETEVFIHGWLDGVCRTAWMREMKEQLFQRGHYNVILVDWTWGNTPDYYLAGQNCKIVGEQVGFIIKNIMRQTGCGPEKFHVIGHSLGAVAGGFVGRSVDGLRRITGLDPAYPPFSPAPPDQRVTYRDAQLVDNIHSNGYTCIGLGIGDSRFLGHADFYPNGGKFQPSCYITMFKAFLKMDLLYALASLEPRLCSHLQSLQFYKLSINPSRCEFVGVVSSSYSQFKNSTRAISCKDWGVMGMDYEFYRRNSRRKKFFLDTLDTCPYYDDSYLQGKKFRRFNTSCAM